MSDIYFIRKPDGYFIIEDANGNNITREKRYEWLRKGNNMKRTNKNYKVKRRRLHGLTLGKGIAITTMAAVSLASLPGCDLNESGVSQIVVDPTSSFVVIDGQTVTPTPAITDGKGKQTVTPTPTGAANSKPSTQTGSTTVGNTNNNGNGSGKTATPTPKPTNNTTSTSAETPTPKPSGQGSSNATATPNPTNNSTNNTTAEPTSTPSSSSEQTFGGDGSSSGSESSSGSSSGGSSHTADPYSESCDCPYCSGDVSYRSARTVHHDAVTHDETDVSYDRIVRTYQYTIVWSDNILNYCADNGIDLPSPPSATGSVIFDENWYTLDDSGEDNALDSIFDEASDIASGVGFSGAAFGYTSEVIGDEYEGRHENTTTIVDEEAWDENIPAGWYCDSCDYYSSDIPVEYEL